MYRKPKNPDKRRRVRAARMAMLPSMDLAMRACQLAHSAGLMVLSVHAISGRPALTITDPKHPHTRTEWRL